MASVIFLLPFSAYLHLFFIDGDWDNYFKDSGIITYLGGFEFFVYFLLTNLTHFALLTLWYFSEKKAIKYFILLPLSFFACVMLPLIHIKLLLVVDYFWIFASFVLIMALHKTNFKSSHGSIFKWNLSNLLPILILTSTLMLLIVSRSFAADSAIIGILDQSVGDFGFDDTSQALYQFLKKVMILGYLLVWFFIESRWWKYSILAAIVLTANQLFNLFYNQDLPIDEIELAQSGPFLVGLAVFLVLLSKAAENQHQIKSFFESLYSQVEKKVSKRFETRQDYIEEKRKELYQSKEELTKLERLKIELEQELQKP